MTRDNKDLLVGLDIGTSKVVAIVAELHADGEIEVIGTGQHESNGLKKGVVVDIEKTVASIQAALEEAEITSGNKIQQVVTGIAGSHIRSFNSIGMVAIKDKEVTEADVARVIETAKAVAIPTDQQILHVLPQEFIIDGQEDIREPVGMSGVRLDVKVHVVTGAVSAVQNIIKCVRRCGLAVRDLILQPLASANAVLTHDEKELGVALVDIGGGTTDIAVFVGGSIRHSAVIPVAGDQITNDIAMALRTPTADAEEIKLRHGLAKPTLANPGEKIEVPGIGDRGPRSLSKQGLASVIEPRVEELFQMVQQTIRESGYEESLSSGIVLTGGQVKVDPAPADGQTVDAEQVEKSILTGWLKPGGVKEHATISHPKYGEKQVQPIVEGPGKKAVSAPLVLHGRDNINGEIPVDRMGEVVTFRPENDEFKIDFNYDRAREIFAEKLITTEKPRVNANITFHGSDRTVTPHSDGVHIDWVKTFDHINERIIADDPRTWDATYIDEPASFTTEMANLRPSGGRIHHRRLLPGIRREHCPGGGNGGWRHGRTWRHVQPQRFHRPARHRPGLRGVRHYHERSRG